MFKFKGGIQDLVDNELFLLSEGEDGDYITLSKFLKKALAVAKNTNESIPHSEAKKLVLQTLQEYVSGETLLGEWVEMGSWYLEVGEMVRIVSEAMKQGIESHFSDANLTYYGE